MTMKKRKNSEFEYKNVMEGIRYSTVNNKQFFQEYFFLEILIQFVGKEGSPLPLKIYGAGEKKTDH